MRRSNIRLPLSVDVDIGVVMMFVESCVKYGERWSSYENVILKALEALHLEETKDNYILDKPSWRLKGV